MKTYCKISTQTSPEVPKTLSTFLFLAYLPQLINCEMCTFCLLETTEKLVLKFLNFLLKFFVL